MAGTYSTYYFDGLNFSTATAIYTDAALTTLAADGFYAQNNIVRQQSNGLLLNAQSCSSCAVACGSGVSASGSNPGYYNADIDVANDTGAVVIYYYMTSSIPDGVIGTFNNVAYNRMTSKYNHNGVTLIDGSGATVDYSGINNADSLGGQNIATYVGNEDPLLIGNYANVAEYNLVNNTYVNLGTTRNISVVNNQVGYADDTSTPTNSPVFTMVIPKAAANATLINIQIFAPMGGTAFDWEVLCPTALPNFQGSNLQADDTCVSNDETYYFSRNATGTSTPFTKDTNTIPEIGNFVFTQPDGSVYANDTSVLQYIIVDSTTALGIRNGVVVSSAACSNTGGFKSFSSSSSTSQSQICDNNSPPSAIQTFYHNGTGIGPGSVYPDTGDTAYTTSLGTETATGSVDAGWGRGNWGSFAWNENIEFITNVSGVSMSFAEGALAITSGIGVNVNVTGLQSTFATGTPIMTGFSALVTPTPVTMSMALSGATVSGEGSVGVVAPSDQLDFNLGTPVVDIFTQVDATSVQSTFTTGSVSITGDAPSVDLTGTAMTSALGSPTIGVGSGVIVSVSTVALSFAHGS